MSLCPDREYRESLSEDEFWDYVLLGQRPGEYVEPEPDDDLDEYVTFAGTFDACPECGEIDACGYDAEGRPMIHTTNEASE